VSEMGDWMGIADKAVKAKPFPLKHFRGSHKDEEKMVEAVNRYLAENYGFQFGYPVADVIAYIVDDVCFQFEQEKIREELE